MSAASDLGHRAAKAQVRRLEPGIIPFGVEPVLLQDARRAAMPGRWLTVRAFSSRQPKVIRPSSPPLLA
jgi:hypothetical protein